MPRELPYTVLDVFAERPLEGNPLAVFHDGRGLSDSDMQALARETNLSETTFVLPSLDPQQDREEGVRVRIFTTQEELPFAGHPTLGTATWLHLYHPPLQGAQEVTLQLAVGPVPVRFPTSGELREGGGPGNDPGAGPGVYGSMRQPEPVFGEDFEPSEIAAILGLPEVALLPGYRPATVSTGNPFCIVPLRSVEALNRLAIPQAQASVWLQQRGIRWFYCIAPDAGDPLTWHARMQWYGGEDPATGSAAGPCIAWLVRAGLVASGVSATLLQGAAIQRPSRLVVRATVRGGVVGEVDVAGRTIPVAAGKYFPES